MDQDRFRNTSHIDGEEIYPSRLVASPVQQWQPRAEDNNSDDDSMIRELRQTSASNEIVTDAPAPRFRLTTTDVVCLVLNRMIGSGIFMTPQVVMKGTNSTGAALLLWFAGAIHSLAGMYVYIEYGLNVPRVVFQGVEQSVPRSGGDLHYLQYVYRWVGYRGQTVLLITCLFGISFIILGNMAGNCINFAIWISRAAGYHASDGALRGIALAVATFSCCIHAFSRRGGILLNDILAIVKVFILLMIIVTAIIVAVPGEKAIHTKDVFSDNMNTTAAFEGGSNEAYGYSFSFLSIIFAYSGFEQPNYVLGEIGRPRQRFPLGIAIGTITGCVLYIATNLAYMAIVPKCVQENAPSGVSVAEQFFNIAYGGYKVGNSTDCSLDAPPNDNNRGYHIFSAFLAISSFGNIVVMTYTAARVKQEIAKNGILPFAKFFAHNSDVSVGHVLKWIQRKGWFRSIMKFRWFSPEEHMEKTPVGALILHELSCIILICITLALSANNAYTILVNLAAYVIYAFFGALLGLGILILRFAGPPELGPEARGMTWTEMTGPKINPTLSVLAAAIYFAGNMWPLVACWIPPAKGNLSLNPGMSWFIVPVVSCCVLGLSGAWFLGFFAYAKRKERRVFKVFTVDRSFDFETAGDAVETKGAQDSGLILSHETVYLAWQAKENM